MGLCQKRLLVALIIALSFVTSKASAAPLKFGDRGSEVKALQEKLSAAGFFDGPRTGYFGPLTRRAVIEFQRAAGLAADGIVGPLTSRALSSRVLSSRATPTSPGNDPQVIAKEHSATPKATSGPSIASLKAPLPGKYEVVAYYCQYHAEDMLSFESLRANGAGTVDGIAAFLYSVTKDGDIVGQDCTRVVELARSMGIKPLALVNNISSGKFNKDVVHRVLADRNVRGRAVENIYRLVKNNGFAGVNIDFENVPPSDRDNYTQFVRELAARMKPEGLLVTLSVPAKKREDPNNSWSAAFDYWSLGEIADRIMIMTYDQHWSTSSPGPIAGVDWVENMLEFATSAIPSHKILMGLPTYGYDWQVGSRRARSVPSSKAVEIVKAGGATAGWDDTAQVPYYTYRDGRQQRIVYYEDARSASIKLDLVARYRLGGIAIWRLGYEDPDLWTVLRSRLRPSLSMK